MRRYSDIEPRGQLKINFDEDDFKMDLGIEEKLNHSSSQAINPGRRLRFLSIGSGSSGNCYYLGHDRGGILIDAGIRMDEVEKALLDNGLSMHKVSAILLTHDHSDHIKFVYTILRKYKTIRLYCTNRVMNAILRRHSISKRIKEYHDAIYKELTFKIVDFEITPFEVPHDSSDSVGFSFIFDNRRFVIATDMGCICDRAAHYISQANYLVIESNYDKQMLIMGRYPEYLKARIQTERGHMNNNDTAEFLAQIASKDLKYIFLCHLSEENNTPEIALKTSKQALEAKGLKVGNARESEADRNADVKIMALPRTIPSPLFVFFPDTE